jgi:nanoRNase/pAp phosphatase (c-di-AMP/oligoRNAs hydrolase)
VNQDLTPKQQTSEAVRQAETILIITGQHPSIDQVASTMALAAVLRKFGKKVTALISDTLPQQVSFLDTDQLDRDLSGLRDFILKVDVKKAQVDKLRYEVQDDKLNVYITPYKGSFAPSDVTFDYGSYRYDLVIVLGVPTRARIDRVFADNQALFANLPIVNLDFHRSNEQYGAINLIEPMASSLSEILVALAESLQNGIVDEQIATALLTGLMASTDRFTATHTTAKSLTVAAQLMAAGAKQPNIVRALFRDNRESRSERLVQSAPKPALKSDPAPVPEFHGPVAAEPSDEPIIDPSHIELIPETADFTAAAEILQKPTE